MTKVLTAMFLKAVAAVSDELCEKFKGAYKRWVEKRSTFSLTALLAAVGVLDAFVLVFIDSFMFIVDEAIVLAICARPCIELFKRLVRHAHSKGVAIPEPFVKMIDQVEQQGDVATKQVVDKTAAKVRQRIA